MSVVRRDTEEEFFEVPGKAPALFRPARVVDGHALYVVFYVPSPDNGQLQRFRKRCNLAGYTKRQQKQFAQDYAIMINDKLRHGWTPWDDNSRTSGDVPLGMLIDLYLDGKRLRIRDSSMKTITNLVARIRELLQERGMDKWLCSAFTPIHAQQIADRFLLGHTISPVHFNACINQCRAVFSYAMERGAITANPFAKIRKLPVRDKNRRLFEQDELDRLMAHTKETMPWYHLACQLTYRCFIRPQELICLKVSDVDLQQGVVTIKSEHGKTGKKRQIILPYSLWDLTKELGLGSAPGHYHIFSSLDYRPGLKRSGENRLGRYFSSFVRPVLGFDTHLVFYSLKDTGITHFLQRGGSIGDAQYQAGHSKASMTAQYVGTNKATIEALRRL